MPQLDDDKVFTVYSWFQSEMRRVGRKISLPQNTDPTKTYQFRWTKTFVKRCQKLGLNDTVVKILLTDIVDYAKSQKVLTRGTQILCMGNITDICIKGIENLANDEASLIEEIYSCQSFLIDQEIDKDNLVCRLIEYKNGKCSNLLYWYNLGHLTEVFMALSKSCNKALALLPARERTELPSKFELLRICTHTVTKDFLPKLQAAMGADLRIPPTVFIK